MNKVDVTLAFPTHVYALDLPDYLAAARAAAGEALSGLTCHSDLHPAIMSGNLAEHAAMQPLLAVIAAEVGAILTEQGYAVAGANAVFESVWVQEHRRHSFMDRHVHPGAHFIGFYFLDVPPDSSAVGFYDPRPGKEMGSLPPANRDAITYASDLFHMAVAEGQLVLTNAWLPHSFSPHGADTPFRFLHLNIVVQPGPPVEVI